MWALGVGFYVWTYAWVFVILCADSAGTVAMWRGFYVVMLGSLTSALVMYGEDAGIVSKYSGFVPECLLVEPPPPALDIPGGWGPSWLTTTLPLNHFFQWNVFAMYYFFWSTCLVAVICILLLLTLLKGWWWPRSPLLASCLFLVWGATICMSCFYSASYRVLGFNPWLLFGMLQGALLQVIMVLDSRYWVSILIDSELEHESLERLLSDPLRRRMALVMQQVRAGLDVEAYHARHIHWGLITVHEKIGTGTSGTVYRATVTNREKGGRDVCAVKSSVVDELDLSMAEEISREIELSYTLGLQCEHIVKSYGFSLQPPFVHIVMQYCNLGSLNRVVSELDVTYADCLRFAADTAGALAHLHGLELVHRDVKSMNVMCHNHTVGTDPCTAPSDQIQVYLGDFGESATLEGTHSETPCQSGTIAWMAPEIYQNWKVGKVPGFTGVPYGFAADCFSLAVVMWECFHRRMPYVDSPYTVPIDLSEAVCEGRRPTLCKTRACPCHSSGCGFLLAIEHGWAEQPELRLSARQLQDAALEERRCLTAAEAQGTVVASRLPLPSTAKLPTRLTLRLSQTLFPKARVRSNRIKPPPKNTGCASWDEFDRPRYRTQCDRGTDSYVELIDTPCTSSSSWDHAHPGSSAHIHAMTSVTNRDN